jgi:hypothetical protein
MKDFGSSSFSLRVHMPFIVKRQSKIRTPADDKQLLVINNGFLIMRMKDGVIPRTTYSLDFCRLLSYGQTPPCEQVGHLVVQHHQRTCWALARPAPNKLCNLLGARLARAQQVGRQVGAVEFRVWCTRHEIVGQQNKKQNKTKKKQRDTATIRFDSFSAAPIDAIFQDMASAP